MTVNRKPTGMASTVPAGLGYGVLLSIVLTVTGALVTANMINAEVITWSGCGYAVLFILIISSWMGAVVSAGRIKRQRMLMCLASGVIYYVLLLISTALFFGGQYSGVGETGLLIFCGSMLGFFTKFEGKNRRNKPKMRLRNC